MNKSMLVGVVAGIAVATAGGVAGYTILGQQSADEQGSAAVIEEQTLEELAAPAVQPLPAPAPAVARAQPAPAPVRTQSAAAPAPVQERCWDEEVTVTEAPKDQHQIGGTAAGAVVGGALGNKVGDSDLSTAVGAAAGAFIGRKIQQRVQDNRTEERTTTTVERRCEPVAAR